MAHQWFGDLVTMAWWDDLWLNEGFASWMENQGHRPLPSGMEDLAAGSGARQAHDAISDARAGTHPIITPIHDVLAGQRSAFDNITYDKGEAVIRMLEAYVGRGRFPRRRARLHRTPMPTATR